MTEKQNITKADQLNKTANSAWVKKDKICEQLYPDRYDKALKSADTADSNLFGFLRDMGQTFSEELPFWNDLCLDWNDIGDYQ